MLFKNVSKKGGNEMTGYNTEAIEALGGQINTACEQAATDIIDTLESGIITPISTEWYTPEGVDFFTSFKETVDGTAPTVQEAFDSFRASIQSAVDNWAQNTSKEGGATAAITTTLETVTQPAMSLNVSAIQASNGNVVGINEEGAAGVASGLEAVQSEIQTKLQTIASGLDASSAFLGGTQADAIQSCFGKVNEAVAKIFSFLTEGDESLMNQINKAVSKYGSVATDVASAFNGAGEGGAN